MSDADWLPPGQGVAVRLICGPLGRRKTQPRDATATDWTYQNIRSQGPRSPRNRATAASPGSAVRCRTGASWASLAAMTVSAALTAMGRPDESGIRPHVLLRVHAPSRTGGNIRLAMQAAEGNDPCLPLGLSLTPDHPRQGLMKR
jgi:hypothetical protein